MKCRVKTQCVIQLVLVCSVTFSCLAQDEANPYQDQIELEKTIGVNHWLPIEFNVKPGKQSMLTVKGTKLFHDALIITSKGGGLAVDLDLVVLCPDSKFKFAQTERYPSRRYRSYRLLRGKQNSWKMEFGKDCVVDAQDLGYPTIELTTPSLSWVEVSRSGQLSAEEISDTHVRIETTGLASLVIGNVKADKVQISVVGSSELSISSVDAGVTEVSLKGLADLELNTLVSARIEFKQGGSSDFEARSIDTDRLALAINGLSDFEVGKLHTISTEYSISDVAKSSLNLKGSADVIIKSLQLPRLELDVTGLCDLDLGQVDANVMKLSASGSTDISVDRLTTDESHIDISGLSDVEIESLESDTVEIHASGSSDVDARNATIAQLDVQSKGISDVSVKRER